MESSCIASSLALFSKPPHEVGIDEVQTIELLPTSGQLNDSQIEFVIPAESSKYVDLANTRLYLKIKVVQKKDGSAPKKDLKLVSLFPHALFRQVDVYLGNKCVSTSTNTYAYRAFIETALSYSKEVKSNLLDGTEYWSQEPVTATDHVKEAIISLHTDLSQQSKMIVNGLPIKLRLIRNDDDFALIDSTTDDHVIQLEKVVLHVRTVMPSSTVLLNHTKELATENIRYYIDRVWIKDVTISSGLSDATLHNIFLGALPNRILCGFVPQKAFNGDKSTDPFTFSHHHVRHVSLSCDGKSIPTTPFEPDFENNLFRREYFSLLQTLLGDCVKQDSVGLSLKDYKDKLTFFGFTLPTVLDSSGSDGALTPRQTGYINLRLQFKKALSEPIKVIIFSEHQNCIEVDSLRNVYTDYSA